MAGRLYMQKGRYHEAIVSLRSATDLFPGYPRRIPSLPKLVWVEGFLATPIRNPEIARFLHDLGGIAKPFLSDAAATNPRAADELRHL